MNDCKKIYHINTITEITFSDKSCIISTHHSIAHHKRTLLLAISRVCCSAAANHFARILRVRHVRRYRRRSKKSPLKVTPVKKVTEIAFVVPNAAQMFPVSGVSIPIHIQQTYILASGWGYKSNKSKVAMMMMEEEKKD